MGAFTVISWLTQSWFTAKEMLLSVVTLRVFRLRLLIL